MKKYAVFLLFICVNSHTGSTQLHSPLPNHDLFILIAKHFQNHRLPTLELTNTINQASQEAKTTHDWIGIISNKNRSLLSRGHTPVTYLDAYTRHLKRQR